jgi:hypothetical protein
MCQCLYSIEVKGDAHLAPNNRSRYGNNSHIASPAMAVEPRMAKCNICGWSRDHDQYPDQYNWAESTLKEFIESGRGQAVKLPPTATVPPVASTYRDK